MVNKRKTIRMLSVSELKEEFINMIHEEKSYTVLNTAYIFAQELSRLQKEKIINKN